jgi:hypothetical protein
VQEHRIERRLALLGANPARSLQAPAKRPVPTDEWEGTEAFRREGDIDPHGVDVVAVGERAPKTGAVSDVAEGLLDDERDSRLQQCLLRSRVRVRGYDAVGGSLQTRQRALSRRGCAVEGLSRARFRGAIGPCDGEAARLSHAASLSIAEVGNVDRRPGWMALSRPKATMVAVSDRLASACTRRTTNL